jgi:outer membrane protein assembly factor BamB
VSQEKSLPVEWGAAENISWKVPLPGRGTSTPIVWGDSVLVTFQIGAGPIETRSSDDLKNHSPVGTVRFAIQCFRRTDGQLIWQHQVDAGKDLTPVHPKHNLATPSVVTDGKHVYAWFGTGQLLCLNMQGKLVWQRQLAKEHSPFKLLWAHGSSPLLHKDSLYLLCDHDPAAYLLCLDKTTGKTLWKADRGSGLRSYSTPFMVSTAKGEELIVNSNPRLDAYNPDTGELLWHVGDFCRVPIPMPVFANGVLFATRGYHSGPYMAIRPGGRGDVSKTHVTWRVATGAPYVSSPLYLDGLLYMATENGIVFCVDAETGTTLWKERVGGVFSASPVAANGRVYCLNEAGETVVLQAGRKFSLLHRNVLNERTLASPALANGHIFIRSDQHLFCIGK